MSKSLALCQTTDRVFFCSARCIAISAANILISLTQPPRPLPGIVVSTHKSPLLFVVTYIAGRGVRVRTQQFARPSPALIYLHSARRPVMLAVTELRVFVRKITPPVVSAGFLLHFTTFENVTRFFVRPRSLTG